MKLAEYIGLPLKSDAVIDLLEDFDVNVMYDFDRLHENTPDSYSASAREAGFEMRFNADQILDVIWCYIQPRHGFSAVDPEDIGVPSFDSFIDAKSYARESGLETAEAGDGASWLRVEHKTLSIHYEFSENRLALLTLMLK